MFEELETGLRAIEKRLAARAGEKQPKASPAKPRFPSHLRWPNKDIDALMPWNFKPSA